ncbi:MAG: hybrid sensor histidine kinase/response regulator [Planctomycetota bacterium]
MISLPEVLIVDDLPQNIIALREVLEAPEEMLLLEASSGKAALELALEHDFALILLDVQMPDMDGYETAELLRGLKKTKQIPIIFITAINKESEQVFSGYRAGAVDYLFKPLDPVLLKAKVGNFIEFYRHRQSLKHYAARLEAVNEELDRFAYTVSHDLKAPLRAIKHLSEYIEEDLGDQLPDGVRSKMNLMRDRIQRMEQMIRDILAYARAGSDNVVQDEVDIGALVQSIIDMTDRPPDFTITLASSMPTLRTAAAPLQQVLTNLISNAVRHHHKSRGRVEISYAETEGFHQFSVSDDGPGIPHAYHEKVFDLLRTLRSRDEMNSSGIGLAIVKKLVESAGGWVEVRSVEGEGASFIVFWPKEYGKKPGLVRG